MSKRGKKKEIEIEDERPLVDPAHPDFTIGLAINGNHKSVNFIKESGDVSGPYVKYYTSLEKFNVALEEKLKHTIVNGFTVLSPAPAKGQLVPLFKVVLRSEIFLENKSKTKVELLPLLFKRHNIYFVGFKTDEGIWYEHTPQVGERNYIRRSKNLPFTCSYLERYDNNKGIHKIYVDSRILEAMVTNLKALKFVRKGMNISYHKIQEFCDIICLFISEATRFKMVLEFMSKAMRGENMESFGKKLEWLIKQWSSKSNEVKKLDADKELLKQLKTEISVVLN